MQDIKTWLEQAGEPVAETCFPPGEAPPLPYVVFLDSIERGGADMKNISRRHAVIVERYSTVQEDNLKLEGLLDDAVIPFTKEKTWVNEIECYMTTYDFNLFEREVF